MKYKLTFTVHDESEEANFVSHLFHGHPDLILSRVAKWGCDAAKLLDQNLDRRIYNFDEAEILEDYDETKNNTDCG